MKIYATYYLWKCSLNWCGESDKVPGAKTEEETKVERFKGGRAEMQVDCVVAIGSRIRWCQVVEVWRSAFWIHWLLPHLAHLSIFQGGQKVKLHFHRSTWGLMGTPWNKSFDVLKTQIYVCENIWMKDINLLLRQVTDWDWLTFAKLVSAAPFPSSHSHCPQEGLPNYKLT